MNPGRGRGQGSVDEEVADEKSKRYRGREGKNVFVEVAQQLEVAVNMVSDHV